MDAPTVPQVLNPGGTQNIDVELTTNETSEPISIGQSVAVAGGTLPKKNVRGKSRGVNADKIIAQHGTKIPITLKIGKGRPTGEHAEMVSSEIGFIVRNHLTLDVESWKHVPAGVKTTLEKRLTATTTGLPLGAIDQFEFQYKSETKGWDPVGKEKWDQMMLLRSETTSEDGTRSLSDANIVAKVLGSKSGYIKGRGYGPKPISARTSQSTVHEIFEKNKDLEHTIEVQNEEITTLKAKAKEFDEFIAKFNAAQAPMIDKN